MLEPLESRFRGCGLEKEIDAKKRLQNSVEELMHGLKDSNFEAFLTNDYLDSDFDKLLNVVLGWRPHLKQR